MPDMKRVPPDYARVFGITLGVDAYPRLMRTLGYTRPSSGGMHSQSMRIWSGAKGEHWIIKADSDRDDIVNNLQICWWKGALGGIAPHRYRRNFVDELRFGMTRAEVVRHLGRYALKWNDKERFLYRRDVRRVPLARQAQLYGYMIALTIDDKEGLRCVDLAASRLGEGEQEGWLAS